MMESGWHLLLIFGPVAVVAMVGAGIASGIAYYQYGWRGWRISLIFTLMGAAALIATYVAVACS
jgi:hypothetical protein